MYWMLNLNSSFFVYHDMLLFDINLLDPNHWRNSIKGYYRIHNKHASRHETEIIGTWIGNRVHYIVCSICYNRCFCCVSFYIIKVDKHKNDILFIKYLHKLFCCCVLIPIYHFKKQNRIYETTGIIVVRISLRK